MAEAQAEPSIGRARGRQRLGRSPIVIGALQPMPGRPADKQDVLRSGDRMIDTDIEPLALGCGRMWSLTEFRYDKGIEADEANPKGALQELLAGPRANA